MLNQSFLSLWKLKELRSIQLIVCQCFRRHLTAAAPAAAANPIAGHSFPLLIFFCFWFCFDQSSKKHLNNKKDNLSICFPNPMFSLPFNLCKPPAGHQLSSRSIHWSSNNLCRQVFGQSVANTCVHTCTCTSIHNPPFFRHFKLDT